MAESFAIRGFQSELTIVVHGYERGEGESLEDRNWLSASAKASAGSFRGALAFALTTDEVADFAAAFADVVGRLEGTAVLQTMEEAVRLSVAMEKGGRATVEVLLQEIGAVRNKWHLQFGTDQTFLRPSIEELRCIVRAFPEITQSP